MTCKHEKLILLAAILLCGCAAHKPKAAIPAPKPLETCVAQSDGHGGWIWYKPDGHGHCVPEQPTPKPEWICHTVGSDPVSDKPTPVGIFLWKYTRLQRVFGVKCVRMP